jgi:hypothetical protein
MAFHLRCHAAMSPPVPFDEKSARARGHWSLILSVLVLVASIISYWVWSSARKNVGLDQLDAGKREAAYAGLSTSFANLCEPRPVDGFSDDCRDIALLLEKFPECDFRCHEQLALSRVPQPAR